MNRHDVHELMDILSAVCTVIVSILAIWGSVSVWSSGIWHKLTHIVEHYHTLIVEKEEQNRIKYLDVK